MKTIALVDGNVLLEITLSEKTPKKTDRKDVYGGNDEHFSQGRK